MVAVWSALPLAELVAVCVASALLEAGEDAEAEAEAHAEGGGGAVGVAAPLLKAEGGAAAVAVAAQEGDPPAEGVAPPSVGEIVGEALGEALALAHPLAVPEALPVAPEREGEPEAVSGLSEAEAVATAEALALPEGDALTLSCDAEGVALPCAEEEGSPGVVREGVASAEGVALRDTAGEWVALREAKEGVAWL